MQCWMVVANVLSWSGAIAACKKGTQWMKAFGSLLDIVEEVLKPDVASCSAAMGVCVNC